MGEGPLKLKGHVSVQPPLAPGHRATQRGGRQQKCCVPSGVTGTTKAKQLDL